MKRSGFKPRKTPLRSRTPIKRTKGTKKSTTGRTGPHKRRKTPLPTLRRKCDALLTPIIKKQHPYCLLCGKETQVAHHHVHKSKSSALRYYIPNLVNLCNHCHIVLHRNESYWASKVVQLRGLEWFEDLEKRKQEVVKTDRGWYEGHFERLSREA